MAQQFTKQLNIKIDFGMDLARNLDVLDSLIKEMKMNPTGHQALSAYQLICKQYLAPKTPSQSSNTPSSPRASPFAEINDPEMFAHFSFAKKTGVKQTQMLKEIKPQRLFRQDDDKIDDKKGRSEKAMPSKNRTLPPSRNYISSFQLPISVNDSLSSSRPQDLKQMSRMRLEDMELKEEKLCLVIKQKHFQELINLIRLEKKIIRQKLRLKSSEFFYKSWLLKKGFESLKNEKRYMKSQSMRAVQFSHRNDQIILQDFFLEWKQRALMTQIQRDFEKETEQKYVFLCKLRVVRSIQTNHRLLLVREDKNEERICQTQHQIRISRKKDIFSKLREKNQNIQSFKKKQNEIIVLQRKQYLNIFQGLVNKFKIFRSIREEERSQFLLKHLSSKKLLLNMKTDHELKKVYWKHPKKIIFLKMIFEAISESMIRKGYQFKWMKELPLCIEQTDQKLNFIAKKDRLSRLFNAFKDYLTLEKYKIQEVKLLHGHRVLKQLLNNYRISMIKQKQEYHADRLTMLVDQKRIYQFFDCLRQDTHLGLRFQQFQLKRNIKALKVRESFKYFAAHRIASKYYQQSIGRFVEKRDYIFLKNCMNGLKQVLLTQIINKKIINQFRGYCNLQKVKKIFECMKQYTFEERFMKKRVNALKTLRMSSYFQIMIFSMRIGMYGRYKQRQSELSFKVERMKKKRTRKQMVQSILALKKNKMGILITSQIDRQYQLRFQWKIFTALKFITQSKKKQVQLQKIIKSGKEYRIKALTIDRMISKLLMSLLFRNADKIGVKYLERKVLKKITQFDIYKEAIKEDTHEELESVSEIHHT